MALYRTGTAAMSAAGKITGTGTKWKQALSLIRTGATIVLLPGGVPKFAVISEIISDTEMNAIATDGGAVANSPYVIFLNDSLTVDGMAQDVAETLRYYQSKETVIQDAIDFFENYDFDKLKVISDQIKANADAAKTSETNAKTSETNAKASENASNTSKNAAAASATAADASKTAAAGSAATATTKASDAAKSAQEAANSAASTAYVTTPFPDVWAPLSDDLRLLAGNGAADSITISGTSYPLPSKSINFSRAGTATYVDKSGALQTAAVNAPRFEKEGLLIEAQSTNLVVNSVDPFVGLGVGIVGDGVNPTKTAGFIGPDGSTNAMRAQFSRGTASGENRSFLTTSPGQFISTPTTRAMNLQLSVWLKSNTGVNQSLTIRICGWTNQVVVTPEWQRFTVGGAIAIGTVDNTCYVAALFDPSNGLTADVLVFGLQIEELPFATSYIPTSGASATRAPDIVSIQESGNIPSGNDITYAFEIDNWQTDKPRPMFMSGNRIGWVYQEPATKRIAITLYNGSERVVGNNIADIASGVFGMSFNKDSLTIKFLVKSVVLTAGAYIPPNTITGVGTIYLSNAGESVGGGDANVIRKCHIRNFRIWHRTLSDIQMRGLR